MKQEIIDILDLSPSNFNDCDSFVHDVKFYTMPDETIVAKWDFVNKCPSEYVYFLRIEKHYNHKYWASLRAPEEILIDGNKEYIKGYLLSLDREIQKQVKANI